jgi:hypothetical protein
MDVQTVPSRELIQIVSTTVRPPELDPAPEPSGEARPNQQM